MGRRREEQQVRCCAAGCGKGRRSSWGAQCGGPARHEGTATRLTAASHIFASCARQTQGTHARIGAACSTGGAPGKVTLRMPGQAMRVTRQGRPGRAECRAQRCPKQPRSGQPRTQGGQLSAITAVPCHSWAPGGCRRAGHQCRRQRCPGALHWGHMHIDNLCTGPTPAAEARRRATRLAWGGRGGMCMPCGQPKKWCSRCPLVGRINPIRQQARLALTLTTRYCRVQLPLVTLNKPPDAAASAATVTAVFPGSRAVLQQQQSKSKGRGAGLQSAKGGGQRLLRHLPSPQTAQPK